MKELHEGAKSGENGPSSSHQEDAASELPGTPPTSRHFGE
jgi:hypothetical protein